MLVVLCMKEYEYWRKTLRIKQRRTTYRIAVYRIGLKLPTLETRPNLPVCQRKRDVMARA